MTTRIRSSDHISLNDPPSQEEGDNTIEIEFDRDEPLTGLKKVWVCSMLIALKDKASRLTFRSCEINGVIRTLWFTMTIGDKEVDLVVPPAEFVHRFVDAAHALIAPGWLNGLKWRFGKQRVVTAVVDLEFDENLLFRWCGVCFRSGSEFGAEFVHLGFPFEPDEMRSRTTLPKGG
ncbi:MAG: hypothetical protein ACRC8S_18085 [Fimbriiglobus sp.]